MLLLWGLPQIIPYSSSSYFFTTILLNKENQFNFVQLIAENKSDEKIYQFLLLLNMCAHIQNYGIHRYVTRFDCKYIRKEFIYMHKMETLSLSLSLSV